jgi:hypothetical protein
LRNPPELFVEQQSDRLGYHNLPKHADLESSKMARCFDRQAAAACDLRLLRQPSRAKPPRPVANSGRAAGSGATETGGGANVTLLIEVILGTTSLVSTERLAVGNSDEAAGAAG